MVIHWKENGEVEFTITITECSNCPWYRYGHDYISVVSLSGCKWSRTSGRCVGEEDPYKYPPDIEDSSTIHPDCPRKNKICKPCEFWKEMKSKECRWCGKIFTKEE